MNFIKTLLIYTICLVAASSGTISADEQQKSCTMGVFPFLSAQRMEAVFAPIAAELSTVSNCSYRYQSAADFNVFMTQLRNRKYDVAFVQPFDYVQIAAPQGYIPLAARNQRLSAVIVTLPNSDIRQLSDLKGKTIALPPSVAAVSYLTLAMFDQKLKVPGDVQLLHTKNHGSCMHKVLIGKVDACATAPTTLRLFEVKNRQKLRVIARSPSIPHALFVVRGDIPDEDYLKLQNKLLEVTSKGSSRQYFLKHSSGQAFRIAKDNEYDVVRDYCKKFRPIKIKDDSFLCN